MRLRARRRRPYVVREIGEIIGSIILILFAILWSISAVLGAIYWAVHEDLLNVVLSIFVPLYGSITVIIDFFF